MKNLEQNMLARFVLEKFKAFYIPDVANSLKLQSSYDVSVQSRLIEESWTFCVEPRIESPNCCNAWND